MTSPEINEQFAGALVISKNDIVEMPGIGRAKRGIKAYENEDFL